MHQRPAARAVGNSTVKMAPPSGVIRGADVSPVFLHDAVRDRQPESGALADVLRRVERFEDARQCVRRDAVPVSRTWATIDRPRAATSVVTSRRPAWPVAAIGVFSVHHHVQEYLVKQQRVALDARQMFVIVSHDFDAGGAVG
jgi:hypothetical protein